MPVRDVDREALGLQHPGDAFGQGDLVFHDEYTHLSMMAPRTTGASVGPEWALR